MKRSIILIFMASFAVLLPARGTSLLAQEATKPEAEEKTAWKPDDILLAERAAEFEVSPDGRWAVWIKSGMDKEKDRGISNLFLTNLETKKEIQLTRGAENHSLPRWSPNGEWISFLSSRPLPKPNPDLAGTQLWLMNPLGGEPYHLTEFVRDIKLYQWIDNDTIIFSAEEDHSLYEQELKRKKDGTRVVDDLPHAPPVRLFKLSVKDRRVTRLTDNTDFIQAFHVSPDGKMAATVHEQYLSFQWDNRIPPKTFVYDLTTGQRKEAFAGKRILPALIHWARDNSGFFAAAPYSHHPQFIMASIHVLYFYNVASSSFGQVDLGWENGLSLGLENGPASGLKIVSDGFIALLANGARNKIARYVKSGNIWKRTDLEGDHVKNMQSFALSEDGKTFLYQCSTASLPVQWNRATLEGNRVTNAVQITDLNPGFKKKTIAKTEVIRWMGALGEEVEGILYYPHHYEPGKKYPLLTAPHGGPAAADLDVWDESCSYAQQLLNQRGAFVLKPNYHGSSNYGLKWVESICCGKYYELPVKDIETGVDHLIARGLVDPDRIATFGWSNGAILSIALSLENPDRYKAVSAGAGDVEWISDWANVDFGQAFDTYYFGKSPLEDPQLYLKMSPLFKMDRLKAPTIIYFGTEDRNVPTSQGWTHYRALYYLGKTVRFLLFPGEPHSLQKLSHQTRKLEEEMAWFDRYLFKTEKEENEAFQRESPLGQALRRRSTSKLGILYGVAWKPAAPLEGKMEILIPEVIKRGDLEIGRFEVTRAQFAAFDPTFVVEPGKENYPANNISLEKAKAYAEWLKKLTGQAWRLPDEAEVASLYEGRMAENTLDYWAGYALNPEDAQRLESKVKELDSEAPLLKEVGSFPGAAKDEEELVFDLGGNVAEWAYAANGSGKLLGGSADRPADIKSQRKAAGQPYTGFRVVRGEAQKSGQAPEKKG